MIINSLKAKTSECKFLPKDTKMFQTRGLKTIYGKNLKVKELKDNTGH